MGIASNTPLERVDRQTLPWYRYGWPWFLISFPLISMILGAMMLYLGLNTNNSMVVDDYYKEGKAINQRIERDRTAALLGLQASIYNADNRLAIDLSTHAVALPPRLNELALVAKQRFTPPSAIQLRWVHVTQAEKDGQMTLLPIGGSRFISDGTLLPQHGKYRLHLQPPDSAGWRLVSPLTELNRAQSITVIAPAPDDVFNRSDIY